VESSHTRVDNFMKELRDKWGVKIVDAIPDLCGQVDGILIESVDGRVHLAQARQAVTCHKPIFIDKPLASTLDDARAIAALLRDGGAEGLPAVRAIGIWLAERGIAQVSTNVEDHRRTALADVVEAVERHAPVARAELVGLAPRAAFDHFPENVPVDNRRLIEDALTTVGDTD
jgi:hypothetical protein